MPLQAKTTVALLLLALTSANAQQPGDSPRPRASDLKLKIGVLPPGPLNAITDVAGVQVGQTTINRGTDVHTGVTAVLPHPGNLFRDKVPGAVFVGNAFGKLAGSTQVEELGEIETPILLTSTLSVPRVADAVITYMLALPGNEKVLSINPLVGETNDGYLSDIRGRHITPEDVFAAIKNAKGGPVEEGCVGAGAGTVAFGWKGGIGTASRRLPASLGGYTVGVLVQTNFGGVLTIAGAPVGQALGQYYLRDELNRKGSGTDRANGSVMIVIATDAPLGARNLKRLAARAMLGLGRTGSAATNGSGDYAIAFSTASQVRIRTDNSAPTRQIEVLTNDAMSPLFLGSIEATEEAIYNSLFRATTTVGQGHTVEALPIDKTVQILRKYGALR
ncbi:MAG TPA: P1 family peptidase [Candidatus Angelobacter sp.]|jgi:D-aminopeptidase|nr:P1 family peptidase [Candidatus Angelobacter sp.]